MSGMASGDSGLASLGRALAGTPDQSTDALWRSLAWFNAYRLLVAVLMLAMAAVLGGHISFGSRNLPLFVYSAAGWLALALAGFMLLGLRRHFLLQLLGEVVGDIVCVMLLTYASGGISSGLPLLLLTSLAAAGLVSRGRLSLFFAAIASLAVLLEHTLQVLRHEAATGLYIQAGLVSIGYFAIAILAHTLVRYLAESERRAAERDVDLANLSQVNQLVIQDMQDGVLVVDERGVIRQYNARAEELLGPVPRGRREVLLKDYAPRLSTRLKEWNVNPVIGFDPVSTTVLAQQMNVRIVPVGRTRKVGAVIFLEDLSQVQAQAQQMKLASMGRLTANIAHEIRNPLSAISHAAELLQEETIPNPTVTRLLRIITDNSCRLDRIVQDVLRLNRGEPAAPQSFRAGEFLGLFVEQFCQSERLPAGVVAVEVNGDPKVRFDHGHFSQVMWNLCRNALRHCQRREGSIRIAVAAPARDNRVRLDVCDDGPGVPPQLRGQLFEPFFTTDAGGTGLGLYLAREICQANGATLEYVANASGAQFTIVCQGA
jgi:two-component system sensor histidine kinase PilS (NtrC family)